MKFNLYATLISLTLTIISFSQWSVSSDLPNATRYDDIVFVGNKGWTINSDGDIFHTTDLGETWTNQINTGKYLRSIEFVDENLGFCGSLDSSFYKTTDGGVTWVDVADNISPKPPGICGISAPDNDNIYGCGIWSAPAFIIKSDDGGNTWTNIDMSAYATALVDIEFSSADTGFVTGTANPASDGGIILYTTDGGQTWEEKFRTNVGLDYIWKIQSPDGQNFFASVDAVPVTNNLRILRSNDQGQNWIMDTIMDTYVYTQLVGFIDPMHGFLGAGTNLFETTDGGDTWNNIWLNGGSYNRFHKINEDLAFLTGRTVYKYNKGTQSAAEFEPHTEVHELNVSPNPTTDEIQISLNLKSKTKAQLCRS